MWSREGEQGVVREAVIGAYVESLRMVWIVMCIFAGVVFVASLIWIGEISLTREVETEQGFRYDGKKAGGDEEQQCPSSKMLEVEIGTEKEIVVEVKNVSTDEEEELSAGSVKMDG
jgi:hypothetical protein